MNPFDDLLAHERLMAKLAEAIDQCNILCDEARKVLDGISQHNTDGSSHPDIRTTIDEIKNSTTINVDDRIQQHDENPNAHMPLKSEIMMLIDDMSKTRSLIEELITNHDLSATAHSDIRSSLNALEIKLEGIDLVGVVEEIESIRNTIENELFTQIEALQSVDARHDNEIAENKSSIDAINSSLDMFENDIQQVANGGFIRQEDIDKILNNQKEIVINDALGLDQSKDNGPSLLNFTTTLPVYVPKKGQVKFNMSGAVGTKNPQNAIKYSIEIGNGDFDISPKTEITNGKELTLVTGGTNNPGDRIYFIVTATDTVTNVSVQKAVVTCIARPIPLSQLSLYGLPAKVEPGNTYKFTIRNLLDDGSGRYTYEFESGDSNLIFTPTSAVKVGTEITLTVPSGIERNTELKFKVVVHDTYSDDQEKEFTIWSNPIPGAEGFTNNIPTYCVPDSQYTIKFTGVTDSTGASATYEIENTNPELTFSKTRNILAGENIKITLSDDVVRGDEYTFNVKAIEKSGASVTIPCGVRINTLPDASTITTTLVTETTGGVSKNFKIEGGTDTEADNEVTYEIDAADSNLVFNKTTGITRNDTIKVVIPKVANLTMAVFKIYAVDSLGERSSNYKEISTQINPIYIADTPNITYPNDGDTNVPVDFTMKISAFQKHVDM